ncbi:MAG: pyridoxamine 5'-phosphate oxidase [Bacteroidota bacterium]
MKDIIAHLRKEYSRESFDIKDASNDPFKQFSLWFEQALNAEVNEPNAMILSTISNENKPASRTVLLKALDDKGFVFFTNYNSRKGIHLESNPAASLVFLWLELHKQIIVEGTAEKLSAEESDKYFAIRPRQSQIGAWASPQSQILENRQELENQFAFYDKKFAAKIIKRPEHWGGFRIIPNRIEFWQGRESRLHDRILYKREKSKWKIIRLAP